MKWKTIEVTECEIDKIVYLTSSLEWRDQCRYAAAKANRVLGMLNKTFVSRDKEIWKKLYTSLVRPHLEYAASVWNPNRAKDIKLIEKVQERASRIPTELRDMNYENRLKEWNITRLKDKRVRGGVIQLYKCINELEEISRFAGPKFALNPYGESAFRDCKGKK